MSDKFSIRVASRGTNKHTSRRRCGFAFGTDLQKVEVTLEQFVDIASDEHLLVVDGPPLDKAKAELARQKKLEQAARGAAAQVPATVNFANRDEVAKALQAHADRNVHLEQQNSELRQTVEDLRGELSETSNKFEHVLERLGKLEAGSGTKVAEQPKADEKPAEQGGGKRK